MQYVDDTLTLLAALMQSYQQQGVQQHSSQCADRCIQSLYQVANLLLPIKDNEPSYNDASQQNREFTKPRRKLQRQRNVALFKSIGLNIFLVFHANSLPLRDNHMGLFNCTTWKSSCCHSVFQI